MAYDVDASAYCGFSVDTPDDDAITLVEVRNSKGELVASISEDVDSIGYHNYTNVEARVGQSETLEVTLDVGGTNYVQGLSWGGDFNRDGSIEKHADVKKATVPYTTTFNITAPAETGGYLLSFWEHYDGYDSACGNHDYAERLDMTLGVYEAPGNVQNFNVSQLSDGGELTWDKPNASDDINVLRSETSGATAGDYTTIDTIPVDETEYLDRGLEDGEKYYYRVEAVSNFGSELSAEEVNQVPLPQAEGLKTRQKGGDMEVLWEKVDNSSDGGVDVRRSADGGSTWSDVSTGEPETATSYLDTSVQPFETYVYEIRRYTDHAEAASRRHRTNTLPRLLSPTRSLQ